MLRMFPRIDGTFDTYPIEDLPELVENYKQFWACLKPLERYAFDGGVSVMVTDWCPAGDGSFLGVSACIDLNDVGFVCLTIVEGVNDGEKMVETDRFLPIACDVQSVRMAARDIIERPLEIPLLNSGRGGQALYARERHMPQSSMPNVVTSPSILET